MPAETPHPEASVEHYSLNAAEFVRSYRSVSPEDVYSEVLDLFPKSPTTVLEVAAGSGRDAAWLAADGHSVTAVEPAAGMREAGKEFCEGLDVTWIDSALPALRGVQRPDGGYGFVLAAAVWMHLPPAARAEAFSRLAELAAPGATLIVTLRQGPDAPGRPMHPVDPIAEASLAIETGFSAARVVESGADTLGRADVRWHYLVLQR